MADVDSAPAKKRSTRQRPAAVAPAQSDSPDPIEIAMKAAAAGAVPGSVAQTVLEKHAGLIEIQCRREREELANVRVQRITRWLILGGLFALLLGLAALLWSASRSTALVVEPFRVPQDMVHRGVDGPAVAAQLLDRLSDLQQQTQSARVASSYANDWGDNLAVAIPETGISVSEAWRFLRRALGNETRITGEVWRAPDGVVTVTARAGSNPARSFSGPEAELNRLMTQAAESVFQATQPYRFFVFTNSQGRWDEADAIARRLLTEADPEERKWANVAAANIERQRGNLTASNRHARIALDMDPTLSPAAVNLSTNAALLGHPEQQLAYMRGAVALQEANLEDPRYNASTLRTAVVGNRATIDALSGNFLNAVAAEQVVGLMNAPRARLVHEDLAEWHLGLHDPAASTRGVDAFAAVARAGDIEDAAVLADLRLRIALAAGDPALTRQRLSAAVTAADLFASHADPYRRGLGRLWKARNGWRSEARALSALGEHEAAVSVAKRMPLDCYDCLVVRGEVLGAAGRNQEADAAFAEAARQGPSLPFAYSSWGQARLARGDRAGAVRLFQEAHRRGSAFADPLKYWGDALLSAGRVAEAEQRYALAAERAPRWAALHMVWADALWRLGRKQEAQARLKSAATMDLNVADRLRLERMIKEASRRG